MNFVGFLVANLESLFTIIKQRNLKPDACGNYQITREMMAEAKALDDAH
jgi:hypothetical protein